MGVRDATLNLQQSKRAKKFIHNIKIHHIINYTYNSAHFVIRTLSFIWEAVYILKCLPSDVEISGGTEYPNTLYPPAVHIRNDRSLNRHITPTNAPQIFTSWPLNANFHYPLTNVIRTRKCTGLLRWTVLFRDTAGMLERLTRYFRHDINILLLLNGSGAVTKK
jgi:hypothetical protein